ncbi:MAG TPA: serine/threonine-protein kinase, partial [Thermoanaerobaculia bacterium]|nr:serine/threonine-protein kinase [Thermoanaerobaculia bacterium]
SGAEAPASNAPISCARCGTSIDPMFGACPHCREPVTLFWREHADHPVDGKYRLLARIGAGGMGEVYKVEHVFLRETRVIKLIRPQISSQADVQARFTHEARLATTIKHPNVATLHDFSPLPDGSLYMVWEFIDGQNLAQLIRGGPLAPRHAVRLTIEALEGLDAIHRAAVVHRDISPENVMITMTPGGDERVKIIDLGIAKQEGHDASITESGVFLGKFRYASPEQLGAIDGTTQIDSRSDLYSIGVVLYEMLTGNAPFEGSSPFDYILHHTQETPLPSREIARVSQSPELQRIVERALERDRDKRFQTAPEFAEALRRIVETLPDVAAQFDDMPPQAENLTTPLPTEVPRKTIDHVDRNTKKI